MAILLCRHGQTALNASLVVQPSDTPLDETGIAQADRLAARLAVRPVARILSSDLERARMTAVPIERATGVRAEMSELLHERNFGDVRGMPYAELKEDIYGPDYVPPNGESWDAFHARVARAWTLVAQAARRLEGDLVVVSHGLTCWALASRHCALPPEIPPLRRWENTGVTIADAIEPHTVRLLACTAHLGPDFDAGTARASRV